MKKIFYILTAALLLTGCTVDDTAIDNNAAKTVTFTATLAPKGGASRDQSRACSSFGETQPALAEGKGGATTRAITTGTEGGKEVLTTAWAEGEKIAICYQKTNGDYDKATATVGTPNADGSAPITATLTDAKGGEAQFVYPASLMDKNGDIKWSSIRINQKGYLTTPETGSGSGQGSGQGQSAVNPNSVKTVSQDFDLATATGTIAVTGTEASVSGKVKMENQVCICKFNILLPIYGVVSTVTHYDITIAFEGGETYTLKEIPKDRLNELYVAMRPVSSALATITAKGYISSGGGVSAANPTILSTHSKVINSVTLAAGKFYRNVHATLLSNILTPVTGKVSLTAGTGELLVGDGSTVSGTGGANTVLKIADGATVTLSGVTNTSITQEANIPGIECLGDATIILEGENSVRGREYAPGIFVPEGKTLTIMGSGTLVATGGSSGAGIGGTEDVSCGNIVIAGGTVTATGTGWCAGIGSGKAGGANITCGTITISGGAVTATGGQYAAGIGSGYADQASNACGAITISGGTVTATGGTYAAGIGSGKGHDYDPNGSGNPLYYPSFCGVISITGGTIEATGGDDAAGIGSGSYGRFASISIGSGITRVTATRSNNFWNVPIGKGFDDRGSGAVTIDGQTLSDAQTKGTADLPTFPNLQVVKSDGGGITNKTWTLTPAP